MRKAVGICVGVLALVFGAVNQASAVLLLNEVMNNVPGGADNGHEFIEISGSASESVANVWILWVDADSGGDTGFGRVLNATDLTSAGTVGTNGFLLVRDSATVLNPAPAGATTVLVVDFNPDWDNDTGTFLLVTNFTGTAGIGTGTDLDTDDNGSAETVSSFGVVLDSLTITDSSGGDQSYADDFGGTTLPQQIAPAYSPDLAFRSTQTSQWEFGDGLGANPGPYTLDPANVSNAGFAGATISPGNDNSNTLDVEVSETSVE